MCIADPKQSNTYSFSHLIPVLSIISSAGTTGELGYDGLNGTRKIGPSYAKSVVHI